MAVTPIRFPYVRCNQREVLMTDVQFGRHCVTTAAKDSRPDMLAPAVEALTRAIVAEAMAMLVLQMAGGANA